MSTATMMTEHKARLVEGGTAGATPLLTPGRIVDDPSRIDDMDRGEISHALGRIAEARAALMARLVELSAAKGAAVDAPKRAASAETVRAAESIEPEWVTADAAAEYCGGMSLRTFKAKVANPREVLLRSARRKLTGRHVVYHKATLRRWIDSTGKGA